MKLIEFGSGSVIEAGLDQTADWRRFGDAWESTGSESALRLRFGNWDENGGCTITDTPGVIGNMVNTDCAVGDASTDIVVMAW